jgi:hypothetical protein
MCGGTVDPEKPEDRIANPWRPQAIERLTGLVKAYDGEHGTSTPKIGSLTFAHYLWIKARVQGLPPVDSSTEVSPPEDSGGAGEQASGAGASGEGAPITSPPPAETPPPPPTSATPTFGDATPGVDSVMICGICGAQSDADGHLRHDDAKHEEVAAARKRARAEAEGQQRLL